jgi:spermidine/putrescine transport system permease protein
MRRVSGRRQSTTVLTLIFPTLFWLTVFFTAPLVVIIVYSFLKKGLYGVLIWELNLGNYTRFFDPLYFKVFGRSLFIAMLTTLGCLVIGYPMGAWLATRPSRWQGALLMLLMIPFWTNFLVRTYAWIVLLAREGFINSALTSAGLIDAPLGLLYTNTAVIIGLIYSWMTDMVLPIYANMVGLDPSLIEAAQDLYANDFKAFTRVILPLTMPGIVAGSILVFIPSMGAYVTSDLLGGGKVDMVGNLIQRQFGSAQDWPFGSAISCVLMMIMVIGTLIYFRTSGRSAHE